MTRVADWPEQLIAAVARHETLPFGYGVSDCMQLTMDCAAAVAGAHPYPKAAPKKGKPAYTTKRGAAGCLKRHGFTNIVEAWAAACPEIAVSLARRGDIGIVIDNGAPCAVVCEGLYFVGKPPGTDGLLRLPRVAVERAFAVGWGDV